MKKIIFLLVLLTFLTGCGVEFGQNYKHLQNQDISKLHEVDVAGDINRNIGDDNDTSKTKGKGLFDSLNDNLCDISPECCGKFTDEQKNNRDLEKRAVIENNRELCFRLPDEPFIISCGNDFEEDEILYSKQRCLDSFEEK